MKKAVRFTEYCLFRESGARNSSSKMGLYPLGYGGIGLYPPSDYLTHAADAILYLTIDKRLYNNGDWPPFDIRHLPGHDQWDDPNRGTAEPFSIKHIPGPEPMKNHNNAGDGKPFSLKNLSKR